MRLVADSGLWSTGPAQAATPLVAVLEVGGAVLSWVVDEPPGAAPGVTFTDVARAEWLWRVVGEAGHVALLSAAGSRTEPDSIDVAGVDFVPGSLEPLRRLALGHWLRRWWPASRRDGIAGLDRALLDVEVALLTAGAQGYFSDDTFDSDVAGLLTPHAAALLSHVAGGDPRAIDLVRACAGLADEIGVDGPGWTDLLAALDGSGAALEVPSGRRDDYALAAGAGSALRDAAIARGVASVNWSAVPPGIFDAAENTVDWTIEADASVVARVGAALLGSGRSAGIAVQLRSGDLSGDGTLGPDGRARMPLLDDEGRPVTESAAWDHDWAATSVIVGAPVSEAPETRERVRRWARARLENRPADAFLAEVVAAESDY